MKEIGIKILNFFKHDWVLKLVSLVLAIFIWFLICEYADPDTDKSVSNIPISVNYEGSVPQKEGLGIMTLIEDTVDVRISGSRDTIALMDHNRITASLDMSKVTRSGEYALPVKIDVGGQNITVVSQSIDTVPVRFDKNIVSNVKVNVKISGDVADGFILEEPTMLNSYVTVTGPESIVNSIVSADIEIKQEQFVETNTFSCSYVFKNKDQNVVEKTFLKVDVETIDVTVVVSKEKTVPLSVSIVNSSGGKDSSFCTAKTDPGTIKITGNAEVLDAINSIDLGVIDVAEKSENFETSVAVVLPNGVKNVENIETVKVSVTFNDVLTQSFKVDKMELQNLPKGTDAKISESFVEIKLRGLAEDIKRLKTEDIKLVVDVKNQVLPAGKNKLTAYAMFPDNFNVGVLGKYQLTVVVS